MLSAQSFIVPDAAMEPGFGSVDGYQRAFRNEFGVNPGNYADNPIPIPLFVPCPVVSQNQETGQKGYYQAGDQGRQLLQKNTSKKLSGRSGTRSGNMILR